jgi:glutamate transport system substrate-binding protein
VSTRAAGAVLAGLAVLAMGAVGSALTGCSGSGKEPPASAAPRQPVSTASAPDTLGAIRARGSVVVGVKFDVPLFGLRDPATGSLSGFDVELARIIAAALFPGDPRAGTDRIEFVEAISRRRERMLIDGEADLVISTYTITEARKQLVDFAGPYYVAGQDILARVDDIRSGRIRGVADLNGRKVCSVTGSTSLNNVRAAAPEADTSITFDRYSDCYEALKEGRVDAVTTDDVILLGLARDDRARFALTGNPYRTEPYGIGIRKGDTAMRDFVNDLLEQAMRDGRWQRAFESTLGAVGAVTPKPPEVDRG